MTSRRLTRDLVADTSLWTLCVRVSADSLSALVASPAGPDFSVMCCVEPLHDCSLKSLEDAIYDNSLLLGDFSRSVVVLSTSQLVQVPDGISAPLAERIAEALLPDCDAPRAFVSAPMPQGQVIAAVDAETLNFLKRSFPDAAFTVSLGVLADAVASIRSDEARIYAFCYPEELVVLTFDADGRLVFANRFDAFSPADCAYYILAAAGTEPLPVSLGGEPDLRNGVIDCLKQAAPDIELAPLTLPDSLVAVRRQTPEISDDLIFLARQ